MEREFQFQKGKSGGNEKKEKGNWPPQTNGKEKPASKSWRTENFKVWHPQRVKRPR